MMFFLNPCTEPTRNLALEEYLLTHRREEFFMVWRDRPCIIVGRGQNACAQINHAYVQSNRIPVLRRISGGGAVYHDLGNVNFTLIRTIEPGIKIDYRYGLALISDFLQQFGLEVRLENRSDLIVNGMKISGNAQHIKKRRVLHHGTILFDTNLQALSDALASNTSCYHDNAVDSVRKETTNVRPLLSDDLSVETFMRRLFAFFQHHYNNPVTTALSMAEQSSIARLAESKYAVWEWNFGRSPGYRFENVFSVSNSPLKVMLDVRSGVIQNARFESKHLTDTKASELSDALIGRRHLQSEVAGALEKIGMDATADKGSYRSLAPNLF